AEDSVLVRAGRMNLPFGLRAVEHTLWVREATRVDLNQYQQHGLSVAYNNEAIRAEVMGILGNYQLGPDIYRERGASGYFEYAFSPNLTGGVSTLVTSAGADALTGERNALRQAHGVFGRFAPSEDLALMGELDVLMKSTEEDGANIGGVGYLQADLEVVRGLHLMGTVEALRSDRSGQKGVNLGGWLSGSWYFTRGLELRVDTIMRQRQLLRGEPTSSLLVLAQLHLYL
ncbi:MAG: hypothetical protein L0Y66_23520, partial [Myxococcaceae bacterium]|nr:hypothetical protein [Myxococcaceae bacterium]